MQQGRLKQNIRREETFVTDICSAWKPCDFAGSVTPICLGWYRQGCVVAALVDDAEQTAQNSVHGSRSDHSYLVSPPSRHLVLFLRAA